MFRLIRIRHCQQYSFSSVLRFSNSPKRAFLNFKNIQPSIQPIDKSKYQVIYEFPSIERLCKFLKTKYRFPGITIIFIVIHYWLEVDKTVLLGCFVMSVAQLLITIVAGKYLRNTVGKIYVNKGNEITEVLVSCINQSGKRIDRVHAPKDLVPILFSSKFEAFTGFTKIQVPETDIIYKLNLSSAKLHDVPTFKKLLGINVTMKEIVENTKAIKSSEKKE